MRLSLSSDQVLWLRMYAQRLMPRVGERQGVAGLVQELCGIQAQDERAAALAVRTRSKGLLAADVERARVEERTIVRTWGPRGTLHLLATEDLGWLLPLYGPIFIASSQRRRAELGLDEDTCARGMKVMQEVLAEQGPLTRAEIVEQLALHGVRIEGQARPHLLGRAALEGIICLGPNRGTEPTYVLLRDWVELGQALGGEAALAELARRYLGAYGPATAGDLAAWSGLPMSGIRTVWREIASQFREVDVSGSSAWLPERHMEWLDELAMPATTPMVRLLPSFDLYMLGYRDRRMVVPERYAKRVNAGGGIVHPTMLLNGRVVGTWKSESKKDGIEVIVEPFERIEAEVYSGLEVEVEDVGRFLGLRTTLRVREIM